MINLVKFMILVTFLCTFLFQNAFGSNDNEENYKRLQQFVIQYKFGDITRAFRKTNTVKNAEEKVQMQYQNAKENLKDATEFLQQSYEEYKRLEDECTEYCAQEALRIAKEQYEAASQIYGDCRYAVAEYQFGDITKSIIDRVKKSAIKRKMRYAKENHMKSVAEAIETYDDEVEQAELRLIYSSLPLAVAQDKYAYAITKATQIRDEKLAKAEQDLVDSDKYFFGDYSKVMAQRAFDKLQNASNWVYNFVKDME